MTPEQEAVNDKRDDRYRFSIAILVLLLDFGIMGILLFFPVPEKNKDLVNFGLGLLFGATISRIMGDYFKGQTKDKPKTGAAGVITDNVETVNTNTP